MAAALRRAHDERARAAAPALGPADFDRGAWATALRGVDAERAALRKRLEDLDLAEAALRRNLAETCEVVRPTKAPPPAPPLAAARAPEA